MPEGFDIRTRPDLLELSDLFRFHGRVRIENFLNSETAAVFYRYLATDILWRTFIVADEVLRGTPLGEEISAQEHDQLVGYAQSAASRGFSSVYDANDALPEELSDATLTPMSPGASLLKDLADFLNGQVFREFLQAIIGSTLIDKVTFQALRLRTGQFATFHEGTWATDTTRRRLATFYLDLTPIWQAEWGGIVAFRNIRGGTIEGFVPCFNSLDIFRFPQGNWTSEVTRLAEGYRFAVYGRVYRQ